MVSLECGRAAKEIGVRNVFPSSCGLSPGLFFYNAPIEKPATQATGFCLFGTKSTGGDPGKK